MKIVIIGASGFLGTKLMDILSEKHEVIGADIKRTGSILELDATNAQDVKEFILDRKPDAVIDTVALTSSLACEKNPELAYKLNYVTAKNIADVCRECGAKMVFISSTYLFDGEKGDYSEADETSPMNKYAETKILAEKEISLLENHIIIRVDVMYGFNGLDKPNGVFNQVLSGKEISLRDPNQLRQPVLVEDVAEVIQSLIEADHKGIFHVAGTTRITMIDFLKFLETIIRGTSLIKISSEKPEIDLKIPKNATLNLSKIKDIGIKTSSLEEGIKILKQQYKRIA